MAPSLHCPADMALSIKELQGPLFQVKYLTLGSDGGSLKSAVLCELS